MAATRFLTITDVYERFIKGKKVPEADWDYKIIPETATAMKEKYNLNFGDKLSPRTTRQRTTCSRLVSTCCAPADSTARTSAV
jgi:methylamine--corrinoid protein Co-methyltransferase